MNIRSKIFGSKDEPEPQPILQTKRPKGVQADMLHSVPVAREEARRGNTRSDDRHRVQSQPVEVTHRGERHKAELINLSGGGAMISAGFEATLWERLDLHLAEDGIIECAVRWLKGDRIGLEFAHETRLDCSLDEQASLLREVLARSFCDVQLDVVEPPAPALADAEELRDHRRHPLIWSGALHYDFQSVPVRLRNISRSGALIDCQAMVHVGAEPLLDLGEAGSVFATVSWVVGDQVGLKFHTPFDLGLLAKARPEIAPVKWERPAYLSAAGTVDSPWANEWQRMSLSELKDELDGYMKR